MILLFPVLNSRMIIYVIYVSQIHPYRQLGLCSHDFQFYFTLTFFPPQNLCILRKVTIQIAKSHKSAPLAGHAFCRLMRREGSISDSAKINVILHCNIVISCLDCHINHIQIVRVIAIFVPVFFR